MLSLFCPSWNYLLPLPHSSRISSAERKKPTQTAKSGLKFLPLGFYPKDHCVTTQTCLPHLAVLLHCSAHAIPKSPEGKVKQALRHWWKRILLPMEQKLLLEKVSVGCAQQSQRCSPSTAGHEAAWDALPGLGDLNPAFIIGLETTTTVGQLFFIKKKEAAQHSSRNTVSMTNSFIPSSCLPLCAFPTASEKKDRILMWKWLKCCSGKGGWGLDSLPRYTARIFVPLPPLCSKQRYQCAMG